MTEIVYVQRNVQGKIDGLYAAQQTYAQEGLPDDDPEVVAFLNPPQPVLISFDQLMSLFTPAEQAAIVNSTDTALKIWLLKATGAGHINLSDPVVTQGLNYLVSLGIIASDREAQILANTAPAA